MITLELTPKIQQWLQTPSENRDIKTGAELLLRINRNQILYNNILRNPKKYAPTLEYQLSKLLKQRLIDTTHQQVQQLMVKVDEVANRHGLNNNSRSDFQRGKRADHHLLPSEVQQLYEDNAQIRHKIRDAHAKLRLINSSNSTCPDSDRLPFAKEIIRLDNLYRDNWNLYDHYVKGSTLDSTTQAQDPRSVAKNILKSINMLIGKYAKNPTDAQAERIKALFQQINNPSDSLITKMKNIGLV